MSSNASILLCRLLLNHKTNSYTPCSPSPSSPTLAASSCSAPTHPASPTPSAPHSPSRSDDLAHRDQPDRVARGRADQPDRLGGGRPVSGRCVRGHGQHVGVHQNLLAGRPVATVATAGTGTPGVVWKPPALVWIGVPLHSAACIYPSRPCWASSMASPRPVSDSSSAPVTTASTPTATPCG